MENICSKNPDKHFFVVLFPWLPSLDDKRHKYKKKIEKIKSLHTPPPPISIISRKYFVHRLLAGLEFTYKDRFTDPEVAREILPAVILFPLQLHKAKI